MSTNEPPPEQPTPPSYGETPPPPPPPSYPAYGEAGGPPPPPPPAPPGPGGAYNVGDALNYGWAKFQANVGQILLSAVVLIVGMGIVAGIGYGLIAAVTDGPSCEYNDEGILKCDNGTGFVVRIILQALVTAAILVAAQIIGAGLVRASLNVTEGKPFLLSDVLKTDKIGSVLIAALIIGAATFVGTILCYIPGLIVGFATSYTLYFIIDKNLEPVEAIKASVNLVKDNLGNTLVWYIVGGLIAFIGFVVCFVGALVTVPIVLLGTAYTYKTLTAQPVAP